MPALVLRMAPKPNLRTVMGSVVLAPRVKVLEAAMS